MNSFANPRYFFNLLWLASSGGWYRIMFWNRTCFLYKPPDDASHKRLNKYCGLAKLFICIPRWSIWKFAGCCIILPVLINHYLQIPAYFTYKKCMLAMVLWFEAFSFLKKRLPGCFLKKISFSDPPMSSVIYSDPSNQRDSCQAYIKKYTYSSAVS